MARKGVTRCATRQQQERRELMSNAETPQGGIDYEYLVEEALRSVVRKSLKLVEEDGLVGETHFYITFMTTHSGVTIDAALLADHPETMTIVLQYQFADLTVADDHFSVTLFFGGKPSPMHIPFDSVTSFSDPSVGFGLQFGAVDESDDEDVTDTAADTTTATPHSTDDNSTPDSGPDKANSVAGADVVSLDTFRKRPTK